MKLHEPIVRVAPVLPVEIDPEKMRRLRNAASMLEASLSCREEREIYSAHIIETMPAPEVPALQIDDFTAFSNLGGVLGLEYYTSRAFVRARADDLVAGTFEPIQGYEHYLERYLGLGRPLYIQIKQDKQVPSYSTLFSLLKDEDSLNLISEHIKTTGLVIQPFISTEEVWQIAKRLADKSKAPVRVLGPLPCVSRLANNKTLFTAAAGSIVGNDSVISAQSASNIPEIASQLKKAAHDFSKIALNLSDSASGMGISIFDSDDIRGASMSQIVSYVEKWAYEKGWQANQKGFQNTADLSEAALVMGWEDMVLASPSAQLWIPPVQEGLPIVEGIFEQLFSDNNKTVFLGSVISQLPEEINVEFTRLAGEMGFVLQLLGYTGRCSFDAIVCGPSLDKAKVKFVECNGRWGGTSTPMLLMNRLFKDFRSKPYQAADFVHPLLKGMPFNILIDKLDDILYNRHNGHGWAILYNVGCLKPTGKLDVITIGQTRRQAQERQREFEEIIRKRLS